MSLLAWWLWVLGCLVALIAILVAVSLKAAENDYKNANDQGRYDEAP